MSALMPSIQIKEKATFFSFFNANKRMLIGESLDLFSKINKEKGLFRWNYKYKDAILQNKIIVYNNSYTFLLDIVQIDTVKINFATPYRFLSWLPYPITTKWVLNAKKIFVEVDGISSSLSSLF